MAPAGTATAAPSRRKGRTETPATRRVPLRLVPPRSRRANRGGRTGAGRERLLYGIAVAVVVAALLAVVVAQALLANGQVRLARLQHTLSLEQSAHRQDELTVAQLETPARIVTTASSQLHLVRPTSVIELPYVSLSVPLPTPKVAPAPSSSPATAPATSGGVVTSAP